MIYLLDACAMIAFINQEPEGFKVKELFYSAETGENELYMSIVNLTEVYYNYIRSDGLAEADVILREIEKLPIKIIDTINRTIYREAARLKVHYSLSLADTFLCATSRSIAAVIVTKDNEIKAVETGENLSVFWINKNL